MVALLRENRGRKKSYCILDTGQYASTFFPMTIKPHPLIILCEQVTKRQAQTATKVQTMMGEE